MKRFCEYHADYLGWGVFYQKSINGVMYNWPQRAIMFDTKPTPHELEITDRAANEAFSKVCLKSSCSA